MSTVPSKNFKVSILSYPPQVLYNTGNVNPSLWAIKLLLLYAAVMCG
ncbi:MAG: hypothetical protein LBS81_01090 [Endomicrobium sp.]|jgi:hypothetical protein|nr:hypothetical protein [Endomicrobium sp.]